MAANPLTFTEIEAFGRLTRVQLTPWEVRLIERLDDVALAPSRQAAAPTTDKPEPIPVENVAGIRTFLRSRAAARREAA